MSNWNIQRARELYSIDRWGEGYFGINDSGHLTVHPHGMPAGAGIDVHDLIIDVHQAGLSLPVLLRFPEILHDRVNSLCTAFSAAMEDSGYSGSYRAVYPIKVNQQRCVVQEILAHGGGRVGLEAGSKPELLAVLALTIQADGVVICNGYKDREYIRLALIGSRLGRQVYIVLEKLSELELLLSEVQEMGIQPIIGLRVRLACVGSSNWQNTGGEKSKFGLSASEVLRILVRLRETGLLPALRLLHFHMGSQVTDIHDIELAMRECARYYAELRRQGADICCVDVGGGLGVDYEGTRSRDFCSMNYSKQEYARTIVGSLETICREHDLPHPDIITESGRALTAHHAVLVTNVLEIEEMWEKHMPEAVVDEEPAPIRKLWRCLESLPDRSVTETWHEASRLLAEAQEQFTQGKLELGERARAEQIYAAICRHTRDRLNTRSRVQRELFDGLNERLADKYFCNFSLFQSMPDIWAIEQIFPIVPLHRHDEQPARRGVVVDITCDSDGRIDRYVDAEGLENSLPLHELRDGEPYWLGIFLLGAYQEILGDMHNLLGDTDSVNIVMEAKGGYRLVEPLRGDGVDTVLRTVHFDAAELHEVFRRCIESLDIDEQQQQSYLGELEAGLKGYTYLE